MSALKIKFHFLGQKGGAIAQLMMGIGLSTIVVYGATTVFVDANEQSARVQTQNELNMKMVELTLMLSNDKTCARAFTGVSLSTTQNMDIKDASGNSSFLRVGTQSIRGFNITSLKWKTITVDQNDSTNILALLRMDYRSLKESKTYNKELWINITKHPVTNVASECQSADTYIRGDTYSRCSVQSDRHRKNQVSEPAKWPFITCPGAGTGKAKPTCALGFTPTRLTTTQMNSDHAVIDAFNRVYFDIYTCVKN